MFGCDLYGGEVVNLVFVDRGVDVYIGIVNVLKCIVVEDIKFIDSEDEEDVNNVKFVMLFV